MHKAETTQTVCLEEPGGTNSLARAVVAGFVASIGMLFAYSIAYGAAFLFARVQLASWAGGDTLRRWLLALTDNPLTDLAMPNLYAALAAHLAAGLAFAVVYATWFEPRLRGPSWQRGAVFSLGPWLLSLVVFLPLVGGGMFGLNLGAGPLPIFGNLVLHLVYGITLGALYGPMGDLIADSPFHAPAGDDIGAMRSAEAAAAVGMLVGAALGIGLGAVGAIMVEMSAQGAYLGMPPVAVAVGGALLGAAFGGLLGSLVGLPSTGDAAPVAGALAIHSHSPGPTSDAGNTRRDGTPNAREGGVPMS